MTQAASPKAVLAPFDGSVLSHAARTYQVMRRGDAFYVNMPAMGTEGATESERIVRPVVMTTGSHHMQAYWVPVDNFGEDIASEDRDAFNRLCSSCHGTDGAGGTAVSLVDLRVPKADLEHTLDLEVHAHINRDGRDAIAAMAYAGAIQYTGRLHQFPFVYLIKQARWVHEDDTFLQPPPDTHEPEPYGDNWSDGCDQCHSVRPSYEFLADKTSGAASVVELGISCEACHGPGRAHAEAHRNPVGRYLSKTVGESSDKMVNPSKLDNKRSAEVCAQCHAELIAAEPEHRFQPGQALSDSFHVVQYLPEAPPKWLADELRGQPTLLRDSFWPDGTMRVAGRDFNGMAITGCYTQGDMSCITCHSMHNADPNDQLKKTAQGDQVCLDCHVQYAADVEAHTHHPAASEGSRCYNCHMPHTTVGLLGLIRSHRIDSPSASMTAKQGKPNACVMCHLDKSLFDVAVNLEAWYGQPSPAMIGLEQGIAESLEGLLSGNAVERATYAWHYGWKPAQQASQTHWMAPFLAELLNDPYSAVRFIAGRSLESLPGYEKLGYDYVSNVDQRMERAESARARWTYSDDRDDRPRLLMRARSVDYKMVSSLKAKRDDTPVRVNE